MFKPSWDVKSSRVVTLIWCFVQIAARKWRGEREVPSSSSSSLCAFLLLMLHCFLFIIRSELIFWCLWIDCLLSHRVMEQIWPPAEAEGRRRRENLYSIVERDENCHQSLHSRDKRTVRGDFGVSHCFLLRVDFLRWIEDALQHQSVATSASDALNVVSSPKVRSQWRESK